MNDAPNLFATVAREVAAGSPSCEQYLIFTDDAAIIPVLPTKATTDAIDKALEQFGNGFKVLRSEFGSALTDGEVALRDGATGIIDANGVLVEVAIRQIGDGKYRALFSRVDAKTLYRSLNARVSQLEAAVGQLSAQRS